MEKKYFKLQLKSVFRTYPAILFITIIIVVCIATSCFLLLSKRHENEEKQKITLGVVGNLENAYLQIGLNVLENMETSDFFVSISEMDNEEEAIESLKKREISGYVHVPNRYVERMFWGRNIPARYVTLNAPEGFGTIISTEIAEMISGIVVESQNGVYSMQNLAEDYNASGISKKIDNLMLLYIDSILERREIFNVQQLGVADMLSTGGYYVCGLLLVFMLFWGISCNRLFSSKNIELAKKLNISGVRATKQILCEYLAFFIISIITLMLFAIFFGIIIQFFDTGIPELNGTGISDCIFYIIAITPVLVMITLIQTAIYEVVRNPVTAVVVQFVFAVVLGYLSGCFYPNYFFPDIVQKVASALPVGAGFSYMRKALSGTALFQDLFIVIFYSIFFFYFAVYVRKCRILGDVK